MPEKEKASRKPWDPARLEILLNEVAESAKKLGLSFSAPVQRHNVPCDAPENIEWGGIAKDIKSIYPEYKSLYESKSKGAGTKKGHNGGLEQKIYMVPEIVNFLNTHGILGQTQIPVDQSSGLGICTRALFTSAIVAYVEQNGLKHHEQHKYIRPDANLMALIGDRFDELKIMKPQAKPAKIDPKTGKPKVKKPSVRVLDYNGEQVEHFSFDAIPKLCNLFIVKLRPLAITPQQKEQLVQVRTHLKGLTVARGKVRDAQKQVDKDQKKREKTQRQVVVTKVLSFSPSPNQQVDAAGNPQAGSVNVQSPFN